MVMESLNFYFNKSVSSGHIPSPRMSGRNVVLIIIIFIVAGCSSSPCCISTKFETDNFINYIVIGFGIVSVPKPAMKSGAYAAKTKSLGIMLSDQPGLKSSIGYATSSVIVVPENTNNTIIEASTCREEDGIHLYAVSD
jgi:hypothetical protein